MVVGAASLYGASPVRAVGFKATAERSAAAGCLQYGDVVTLRFQDNGMYMVAEDNGNVNINRTSAFQWERFLLIYPPNLAYAGSIAYNGPVALRSYKHNKYVRRVDVSGMPGVLRADGNYPTPTPDAKWEFVSPTSSTGCVVLDSDDHAVIALRAQPAQTFVRPYDGVARALDTTGSTIDLYRQSWTSFYYDRPWASGLFPDPCPFRGRWDGANCFVLTPPYPGPSVWQRNFYANDTACVVVGWFDGAHCQFGSNPGSSEPGDPRGFVWSGNFYLTPAGWAAQMECVEKSDWGLNGDLKGCGLASAIQVGVYPMQPQYLNGQLIGRTAVPQGQITTITVCWKKAIAIFAKVCNSSLTHSGSHVIRITGLKSETLYKVQASYVRWGSSLKTIGSFNVKTK
jgi:hypothetical protein